MKRSRKGVASPEWSLENIVTQARRAGGPDGCAHVQVFLDPGSEDVAAAARRLVAAAAKTAKHKVAAEIGKVHHIARSFGVSGPPDVVAAIGKQPGVHAILPAEIGDAYPKPVNVRPVEQ